MSKTTAINTIININNQLRRYKEVCISSVDIDDVLAWLNNIRKDLED